MNQQLKQKMLNLALIITSLFGYLEWGQDNHSFLLQTEAVVLSKLFTDPASVLHPFVIFPMLGQIILIITLFQEKPSKILTYSSIAGLGLLLGLMFAIGLMGLNIKIIISTIPFLIFSILAIRNFKKAQLSD